MKFDKVLVPVDGSARSELTVELAIVSANEFGAEVTFLSVVDVSQAGGFGSVDQAGELMKLDIEATIALDAAEAAAKKAGIKYQIKKATGIPGEIISEMSKEYNQIILGVTGKTGMRAGHIGRTAAYVIENSYCPVMTIKFGSKKLETILLPVDNKHMAAIDVAIESAKRSGAKITVLSIKRENDPSDLVNFVVEKIRSEGVECEGKIMDGNPAEVIVQQSSYYNLIIMGTEGRSGLRKVLRGSTAEAVVANAASGVTIVRDV